MIALDEHIPQRRQRAFDTGYPKYRASTVASHSALRRFSQSAIQGLRCRLMHPGADQKIRILYAPLVVSGTIFEVNRVQIFQVA
ncbi:hypothetical protein [Pseudomonas sp. PA15(2017)]|uniref:hypothetical protein n=1 Tax=Pseudomonas sp. PA15(2017) TaxID=1932111 RepID=UPI00117B9CBF|nr:hypothetical protein [Pseudomonas sp. PA15(2017)]